MKGVQLEGGSVLEQAVMQARLKEIVEDKRKNRELKVTTQREKVVPKIKCYRVETSFELQKWDITIRQSAELVL